MLKKSPTKPSSEYGHYFCSSLLLITRNGWKILSDLFILDGTISEFLILWGKKNILKPDFTINLKLFQERSSKVSYFSKSPQILLFTSERCTVQVQPVTEQEEAIEKSLRNWPIGNLWWLRWAKFEPVNFFTWFFSLDPHKRWFLVSVSAQTDQAKQKGWTTRTNARTFLNRGFQPLSWFPPGPPLLVQMVLVQRAA